MTVQSLLTIGALICFTLATIGVPARINLVALGLALLTLTLVLA